MVIQDILDFALSLQVYKDINSIDKMIYENIYNHFNNKDPQAKLDSEDIDYILGCFKLRWNKIFDDVELDYTLNPVGINFLWIELAKNLESFIHKKYLNILIPVISNPIDYNTLSQLTDTRRLENFFLGYDGTTIYRKRAFFEHLLTPPFKFSICRDMQIRKLSPLTIDELFRLYICKQPDGSFSVDGEAYSSFWDFLSKRIFVGLQSSGSLSIDLLFKLNHLVDYYFDNKKNLASSQFKRMFNEFLEYLYTLDLDDINFFYGERLNFNNQEHYLFEVLISIYQEQSFPLDLQMSALKSWLAQKTATDNASLTKMGKVGVDQNLGLSIQQLSDIHHCFTLVVSLLVTHFDYFPLRGTTISLWDKSNTVFGVASQISERIFPLLEDNKYQELGVAYRVVLDNLIKPGIVSPGFFNRTIHPTRSTWYTTIQSGDLSELGIYWFEPEIMIHVLLKYKPKNTIIHEHIANFLDQLIHTYGMHYNRMMKAVRVNVIFYDFIKAFDKADLHLLLNQFKQIDYLTAKRSFINNCAQFISYRLTQKYDDPVNETTQDLLSFECCDSTRFIISLTEINSVGKLIAAFKDKLHSQDFRFDDISSEPLTNYLIKMSNAILSIKELEDVDRSVRQADYLNSPT